ncbi:hypothetical protein NESM_000681400 [Novymonas esmeraldas]|uniref:Uncharacterized protein n=1 Tax=Novymonas esmeraldas TaxID=1808958 RepID=A0AAW0EUS5_9TRYP
MAALITKQRYNWMGYNGTESEEVDTALLRAEDAPADNYSYAHRQQVIAELRERLYHIKRELDLIPEEELRAEEAARERRRAERKRREEEERERREAEEAARAEEADRQRQEREEAAEAARLQREAEEARRREQEAEAQRNAERWRQLQDSDEDSDVEEEQNMALAAMPRTQQEIDNAVQGFAKGTRILLASNGSGYVSYLDGSVHPSITAVEAYNESHRAGVVHALASTRTPAPAAEAHSLAGVRAASDARDAARKKLDAFRALQDPTYAARIRASEKDARGQPRQRLTAEDGDEATLAANCESTKQHSEATRTAYNALAAESGSAISAALSSHTSTSAAEPPAAPVPAPAAAAEEVSEAQHDELAAHQGGAAAAIGEHLTDAEGPVPRATAPASGSASPSETAPHDTAAPNDDEAEHHAGEPKATDEEL